MNELGININLKAMRWFGLPEKETVQKMLSLPYPHVRIPIPCNDVSPKENIWNFSKTDFVIEEAIKRKKKIHLQLGIKSIGFPEVHAPAWLYDKFPYLETSGIRIDKEEGVQEIILEYLRKCGEQYLPIKEIASLHIENEPFSRRLSLTNYRYVSPAFHQKELQIIQTYNKSKIPLVQNVPFDTPFYIPYVVANSDILGLNVYPQCGNPLWLDKLLWLGVHTTFSAAKLLKKKIWITEYQIAPWLTGEKTPAFPFSEEKCQKDLEYIKSQGPEIIFLWDLEQMIWRRDDVIALAL